MRQEWNGKGGNVNEDGGADGDGMQTELKGG